MSTEDIRVEGELHIVFTCDHFMESFRAFLEKGRVHYERKRCIRIVGDATHNQTLQKLKKILIVVVGLHWDPV